MATVKIKQTGSPIRRTKDQRAREKEEATRAAKDLDSKKIDDPV